MNIIPINEGIDHINAYSKSKTKLGRWLSNFTYTPIEHPQYGQFDSIEAAWYWYLTRDESIRYTNGFVAKQKGRQLLKDNNLEWNDTEEFKYFIKECILLKLHANKTKLNELQSLEIPVVHYYCYADKVIIPTSGQWVWDYYNYIRALNR